MSHFLSLSVMIWIRVSPRFDKTLSLVDFFWWIYAEDIAAVCVCIYLPRTSSLWGGSHLDCKKTIITNILQRPWAKSSLFAAAALRPIFCSLIAAFCLENFAIVVYNILVICHKAHYMRTWQIPRNNVETINVLLLACTVTVFGCRWIPWYYSHYMTKVL